MCDVEHVCMFLEEHKTLIKSSLLEYKYPLIPMETLLIFLILHFTFIKSRK